MKRYKGGVNNVAVLEQTVNSDNTQSLKKKNTDLLYKIDRTVYFSIKRIFDVICALLGILMMLPVAIITKICYILSDDTKSIFYKQKRVGKDGKFIYIYKFRSMIQNADEVLKELLKDKKYKKEWDENQKFENDPRITKFGTNETGKNSAQ